MLLLDNDHCSYMDRHRRRSPNLREDAARAARLEQRGSGRPGDGGSLASKGRSSGVRALEAVAGTGDGRAQTRSSTENTRPADLRLLQHRCNHTHITQHALLA
jgi:hypothetical protein